MTRLMEIKTFNMVKTSFELWPHSSYFVKKKKSIPVLLIIWILCDRVDVSLLNRWAAVGCWSIAWRIEMSSMFYVAPPTLGQTSRKGQCAMWPNAWDILVFLTHWHTVKNAKTSPMWVFRYRNRSTGIAYYFLWNITVCKDKTSVSVYSHSA